MPAVRLQQQVELVPLVADGAADLHGAVAGQRADDIPGIQRDRAGDQVRRVELQPRRGEIEAARGVQLDGRVGPVPRRAGQRELGRVDLGLAEDQRIGRQGHLARGLVIAAQPQTLRRHQRGEPRGPAIQAALHLEVQEPWRAEAQIGDRLQEADIDLIAAGAKLQRGRVEPCLGDEVGMALGAQDDRQALFGPRLPLGNAELEVTQIELSAGVEIARGVAAPLEFPAAVAGKDQAAQIDEAAQVVGQLPQVQVTEAVSRSGVPLPSTRRKSDWHADCRQPALDRFDGWRRRSTPACPRRSAGHDRRP